MHEAEVVLKVALIAGNNPTVLAYGEQRNTQPRIINVDQNAAYSPAFEALQQDGALSPSCTLRPIAYLNNIIEQDHRFVKRRARYCLGFGSFRTAWRTLRGFEVMHMIRKGQLHGIKRGDIIAQNLIIATVFGIAA